MTNGAPAPLKRTGPGADQWVMRRAVLRASAVAAVVAALGLAGAPSALADDTPPPAAPVIFCSLPLDGAVKAGRGWDVVPELHIRHASTPPVLAAAFDPVLAVLPDWAAVDLAWLSTAFADDGLVRFGEALAGLDSDEVVVLRGLLWVPPPNQVDVFGAALGSAGDDEIAAWAAGAPPEAGSPLDGVIDADGAAKLPGVIGGVPPESVRAAARVLATLPFRAVDPVKGVLSGIEPDEIVDMGASLADLTT